MDTQVHVPLATVTKSAKALNPRRSGFQPLCIPVAVKGGRVLLTSRKTHVSRQPHEQLYLAGWRAAVPSMEQYEAFRAAPYLDQRGLC